MRDRFGAPPEGVRAIVETPGGLVRQSEHLPSRGAAPGDETSLAQRAQAMLRLAAAFLNRRSSLDRRHAPLARQLAQQQQFIDGQRAAPPLLVRHQTHEREIGRAAGQDQAHADLGAARVGRRGTAVAHLLREDGVDAARGALHEAGALEGVGEQRITGSWRGHQQIVQAHARREAAGVRDFQPVLPPLHVHGAQARVIAVNQGVGQSFPERALGIIGRPDASHAHEDLLLAVSSAKARGHLLHDAQQRPAKKIVDLHLFVGQRLERHLVRRKGRGQSVLASEEKQPQHPDDHRAVVLLHRAQGSGELRVAELEQRIVPPASMLPDGAAVAVELQRVQRLHAHAVQTQHGMIEHAAVGLLRLHLVEVQRRARRLAVPADDPAQVASIRRADRLTHRRYLDDENLLALHRNDVDARGDGWPRAIGNERLYPGGIGGPGFVADTCAAHAAVVFDADQQPGRPVAGPVGETDDRFDELAVRERSGFLALELHRQRLSAGDERFEAFSGHSANDGVTPSRPTGAARTSPLRPPAAGACRCRRGGRRSPAAARRRRPGGRSGRPRRGRRPGRRSR